MGLHLFHDPSAVDLDGFFDGAEDLGGLFIEVASDDIVEDLAFARGEALEASFDGLEFGVLGGGGLALSEGASNGGEEIIGIDGFGEEVDGPGFHGGGAVWDIGAPAEEDNGEKILLVAENFLEFEAVDLGEGEVEQGTAGGWVDGIGEKLLSRSKQFYGIAFGAEEAADRLANEGVVIDDENCFGWCGHGLEWVMEGREK